MVLYNLNGELLEKIEVDLRERKKNADASSGASRE